MALETAVRTLRLALLAWAAALIVLLGARGALAQTVVLPPDPSAAPPPSPPPPTLTLPVLKHDEGAEYPSSALKEGFRDKATVVLLLELDAAGTVQKATVETPVGHGFDEAAVAAAQKLTFEPARRNGAPIAAKIKHKYEFLPPPSRLVGKVLSAAADKPLAGASITLRGPDGTEQATLAAENGAWSFPGVPAGTYHLTIAAAGFRTQSIDQDVAPGEEVKNTLRLAAEGMSSGAVKKPVAGEEEEEEIRVRGQRPAREVTRRTLEQREMNRIPGTGGDALRSLQNLPGVARPPALLGLLIVRGSAPSDTQVFVDGTLIPLVYHFGGLSSVVPTEMLEKIDFYPGNFSTQYGRGMGGIVDVGMRDPKKDKLHGLAQVDFIDARMIAEGPLGKGWSFGVGGRRSYVDVWLKPVLVSAGTGVTTAPVYYDYQAMLAKDFDKNSSFRLLFFGADDKLDILIKNANASDPAVAGGISAHTGFWRLQGRYKSRLSRDTEFRVTSAVGQDFIDFTLGDNFFTLSTYPISARAELAQKIAQGLTMNVGLDMYYSPYEVHVRFPPPPRAGEPPGGPGLSRPSLDSIDKDALYRPALFTEFEITPWRGGRIVPGIRVDYAKDTKAWDVAPRVIARQDLTSSFPRTTLKGGAGVFFQPPQPQDTNVVFGQPGITSNRAIHYDVGVEQELTRQVNISMELFYKQLDHLVVQRHGNDGRGRAFGIETLLRYNPDKRFFGWISYTLSRSVRKDTPTEPERLLNFDQTHILTVLGSYRLGRGWELGSRFRLVSGSLFTPNSYGFYDENAGANVPLLNYPPNGERLPLFHQLDIRVDRTWVFAYWKFAAYLDVQNAYNHSNVEAIGYNYNYTRRNATSGLPIIPSLGIRGEF